MKMSTFPKSVLGQSSLEYLLLLAVVAVVVIAAFGHGALIDQLHNTSEDYYNSVTKVIMALGH
jgi:Flp pilus assembly pilin Flp